MTRIDPEYVSGQATRVLNVSVDLRSAWQNESFPVSGISSAAAGNSSAGPQFVSKLTGMANSGDNAHENLSDSLESASEAMQACAADLSDTDERTAESWRI
ncbi:MULTISPECIES: hypothetical protein [unclassified Actinobaculum]|uniref:hypothetical protein n=1 Tax=unclassified Actinobaculum TaxID=2609299 RepID=UPI000D527B1F|nr:MULTISPECIES: hypothetical protein [unclassified Actinobaculum]AWE41752.1 hypothetical protein DDD63_02120 [Actinobaculum sp. 313]RTE50332.1 hypothetical protein EKN07_03790 [Actinobaculum sp. 352]